MYLCIYKTSSFNVMTVFNSDITDNRSGETGRTFVVPTKNSSYGGNYTCLVSISSVTSEESSGVEITAIGMQIILNYTGKYYIIYHNSIYYTVRPLFSAVLGRTNFWSQKPRITVVYKTPLRHILKIRGGGGKLIGFLLNTFKI